MEHNLSDLNVHLSDKDFYNIAESLTRRRVRRRVNEQGQAQASDVNVQQDNRPRRIAVPAATAAAATAAASAAPAANVQRPETEYPERVVALTSVNLDPSLQTLLNNGQISIHNGYHADDYLTNLPTHPDKSVEIKMLLNALRRVQVINPAKTNVDFVRFHKIFEKAQDLTPAELGELEKRPEETYKQFWERLIENGHQFFWYYCRLALNGGIIDDDYEQTHLMERGLYINVKGNQGTQRIITFIAIYILEQVLYKSIKKEGKGLKFKLWYQVNPMDNNDDPVPRPDDLTYYFLDNLDLLRQSQRRRISYKAFKALLLRTRTLFHRTVMNENDPHAWYENESGLIVRELDTNLFLRILWSPIVQFPVGNKYEDTMMEEINKMFESSSVVVPCNYDDELCLIYSILIGLVKMKWNYFNRIPYPDVNVIKRYALQAGGIAADIVKDILSNPSCFVCSYIDKHMGELMSLKEAVGFFQFVEDNILKDEQFALDIYGCKAGNPCIYPCFASKRSTNNRIKILCIDFGETAHYVFINNEQKVFFEKGRKVFYTCSKCHQNFFTRSALEQHRDKGTKECSVSGDPVWHWSSIAAQELNEPAFQVGLCERCHLMFESDILYEHHMKYCLMRCKRGTSYVELVDKPILHGEECVNPYRLPNKHIMFADFECCIDETNGEHKFMSYGLYDPCTSEYVHGYDMKEFINKLKLITEAGERFGKNEMSQLYVYFHNAMNYDANFVLRFILNCEDFKYWVPKILMKSSSRIQSLEFYWQNGKKGNKIIFGDTFKFMSTSLENMVESIREKDVLGNVKVFPHFFKGMKKFLLQRKIHPSDAEIDKILHKNLFPYNFFNCPEKLSVPFREFARIFIASEDNLKFFSEGVDVEDLRQYGALSLEIMEMFKVESAKDYHDIYLACDVLQIADIFIHSRNTLAASHHIDLCDYIGMPAATWHAFLRFDPKLELPLYDCTIFAEFFQSMTRGGVTSAPLRWAQSDATHSILYFDVNGLYPHVMQEYAYPCGSFKWVNFHLDGAPDWNTQLKFYFASLRANHRGACLRVDLHIPVELHSYFDQYPPAPEHKVLKDCYFDADGSLYEFMKKWSLANDGELMKTFKGLVGTLYDKQEYGVHWRLLEWYIDHGLIVTKVYNSVEFDEGYYLRGYVQKNISIRNGCKDPLRKMVYKFLSNSLYGKTFENPFNYGNFLLVRNRDKLNAVLQEDNVSMIVPIDSNNTIIKLDAQSVVLDKPTYIGACVTEYAKLHMYILFYDRLMKLYPSIQLIYTDTDSFIVRLEHEPGVTYHDIEERINSAYPGLIGPLGGSIKSETGDDIIDEVIALRSKLYAYKLKSGKIGKRAKGTTAAAQKTLDWETYLGALTSLRSVETHNMQFKRQAFRISSVDLVKQSISVNDGKRKIEADGIHTHAWGY